MEEYRDALDGLREIAKRQDAIDQETFNQIGRLLAHRHPLRFEQIFLDKFEIDGKDFAFIVVVFFGGGMAVRNARMNSLAVNIEEMGKLIRGGYYEEVEYYQALRKEAKGG